MMIMIINFGLLDIDGLEVSTSGPFYLNLKIMEKPTPIVRKSIMDYSDIIDYIENKYNIDTRDYAGRYGKNGNFAKYQKETGDVAPFEGRYPDCPGNIFRVYREGKMIETTKEQYEEDFKLIHAHYKRYQEWEKAHPEPEYQDYWHFIIENGEVNNGSTYYWNMQEIIEDETIPKWIRDITKLCYDEFKEHLDEDGGLEVLTSW